MKAVTKKKKLSWKKKKIVTAYLFLLPWIIGLLVFFLPPVLDTMYCSFFTFTLDRSTGLTWNGIENFKTLFNPLEEVLKLFTSSIIEVLYTIPVVLIFSLFIALILNSKFKGRSLVRIIFFLPLIFGLPVIKIILESNAANEMLDNAVSKGGASLGILNVTNAVNFIYDSGLPTEFLDPIINSINSIFEIVTYTGVQILLFLAALQTVDKSLYEVAEIEGANKYEAFFKVTLPSVLPAMKTVIAFTIIDAFARSSIVSYISSAGMSRYAMGVSCALSFSIIIVTLVMLIVFILIIPKGGNEIGQKYKLPKSRSKRKKSLS